MTDAKDDVLCGMLEALGGAAEEAVRRASGIGPATRPVDIRYVIILQERVNGEEVDLLYVGDDVTTSCGELHSLMRTAADMERDVTSPAPSLPATLPPSAPSPVVGEGPPTVPARKPRKPRKVTPAPEEGPES